MFVSEKRHQQPPDENNILDHTISLVRSVYHTVWKEFYAWEPGYCQDIITSLARLVHGTVPNIQLSDKDDGDPHEMLQDLWLDTEDELEIWESFTAGAPARTMVRPITIQAPHFPPYASYESCTPCSRSIHAGDDSDYMPFIPFADDPQYDHIQDTHSYAFRAWEDVRDPDCKFDILVRESP
jgi:histone-lysine N-methyltransferase EZH2